MSQELSNGVARIDSGGKRGTAFLYDNKYLLTCCHNIGDTSNINVVFQSERNIFEYGVPVKLIRQIPNPQGDLALLEIEVDLPNHIKPLPIADQSKYSDKDNFSTFGFPNYNPHNGASSFGIISNTQSRNNHGIPQIQLSNSNDITSGFSGSPIYDDRLRRVIGMIQVIADTDGYARGTEVSFGIPIDFIKSKITELKIKRREKESHLVLDQELTKLNEIDPDSFIGREKEVIKINELINKYKRVVLSGIGGIGKTNLALGVAHHRRDNYNYIIWITVNDKIQSTIINQLRLNIQFEEDEQKTLDENFADFMKGLEKRLDGKVLLVIDNANKLSDFMETNVIDVLREVKWDTLFTSRARPDQDVIKSFNVKTLDFESCKAVFYQYNQKKDDEALKKLLNFIDYHTLLVKLIARAGAKLSINEIYSLLSEKTLRAPKLQGAIYDKKTKSKIRLHSHLVNELFALEENFSELEKTYLQYFSILPSFDIPYSDIQKIFNISDKDDLELWETLKELEMKGWLIQGLDQEQQLDTFKMHPIIQESVKSNLPFRAEENIPLIKGLTYLLQIYPDIDPFDREKYLPFAENIIRNFNSSIKEFYALKLAIVSIMVGPLRKFSSAEIILKDVLSSINDEFRGLKRLAQAYLSHVYWCIDKYELSREIIYSVINDEASKLTHTLYTESKIYNYLGLIQRKMLKSKESIEAYNTSIEILKSDNSLNQRRRELAIAARYNNLAFVYFFGTKDKWKGISLLNQSKEIREKYSARPSSMGVTYSNLANFYAQVNEFVIAEKYLRKCIEIRKKIYPPDHEIWAFTYKPFAMILRGTDKLNEAKEIIEKAIAIKDDKYPEIHTSKYAYYEEYSKILFELKMYSKAEEVATKSIKALKLRKKVDENKLKELTKNLENIKIKIYGA